MMGNLLFLYFQIDNMYNNTSEGMSPISKSKFDEQDFDNWGIKETPKGLKLGYTMNANQNKNKEYLFILSFIEVCRINNFGVFNEKQTRTQKLKPSNVQSLQF